VILDDFKDQYGMFHLLGSLNFSFLYKNKSSLALKDDSRQTTLAEVRRLPVKEIPKSDQQVFVDAARRLTAPAR
jgi:hypothetical protein